MSLALHAGLTATLLAPPASRVRDAPPIESVSVDLVTAAQFAALLATRAPARPAAPEPVTPAPTAPEAMAEGPVEATQFYAANVLAEPRNAEVRKGLAQVDGRERLVQLCDLEAMEQVRRARPDYDPDTVVAYAFGDTVMAGGALVARGAAFRSRREWYRLSFTCRGAEDYSAVSAFAFEVGDFVPHEEWEAHYLTAEEVGD